MKTKSAFFLSALLAFSLLTGCGKKERSSKGSEAPKPPPAPGSVDYLGAMGRAKTTAEKVVDISNVRHAIALFQAGEDRYPESLDELVSSGYLPRLPQLPEGYRYTYLPESGQVRAELVATQPQGQ
ncbi:MAG: hypothetical protein ACOX2U_00330 [Limisphaerales bacterium]|jgi:hypothetical protein|nr:hypothetical protein [Verrucomicrobiota bacterium]